MRLVLFFFFLTSVLTVAGEFSTSLGDQYSFLVSAMTTDSAGNTYVVGTRELSGPENSDVYVTKLDPTGKVLLTYTFGGDGVDTPTAIVVDPTGNIYIAGNTTSDDFPVSNALQPQPDPYGGGFILKLNSTATTILYSTYFGGTLGPTTVKGLATDKQGNLYLTGKTFASDFPHTSGMPFGTLTYTNTSINSGAFITSISAAGDKFLYSGVLSGSTGGYCSADPGEAQGCQIDSSGVGVSLDATGNAYIVGYTDPTNLPLAGSTCSESVNNTLIAKVNAGGGMSYVTCLTSLNAGDTAFTADAAGNIYIGSYGFVTKIKPDASAEIWYTKVGNLTQSISVDANGNLWAVGISYPNLIPNAQGWTTGTEFVAGFNSAGSLTWSALYPTGTVAQSVSVDPSGIVHVAGLYGFISAFSPPVAPSNEIYYLQNAAGGGITARISPAEVIALYGPGIGPATPSTAAPVNGFYPTTLAGVQVTINGTPIPLLYVSANQINAVTPMELTPATSATIQVSQGSTTGPGYAVWILASDPLAFPAVVNQDGTINSQTNPAKNGSIVTFYATGWQSNFSPFADGQVAPTAQDQCAGTCWAGGIATVLYGGAAPGIVAGVSQFNVQLGPYSNLTGVTAVAMGPGGNAPGYTQPIPATGAWVTP